MRWIKEPDRNDPKQIHYVLATEPGDPLPRALVEYWQRILTNGSSLRPVDRASLGFEVLVRESECDTSGYASAHFYTSLNRSYSGFDYALRSGDYNFFRGEKESDEAFNRRFLVWQLDQYTALKEAARDSEVLALFEKVNASYPLKVQAATGNGWFDLQLSKDGFGPISSQ